MTCLPQGGSATSKEQNRVAKTIPKSFEVAKSPHGQALTRVFYFYFLGLWGGWVAKPPQGPWVG